MVAGTAMLIGLIISGLISAGANLASGAMESSAIKESNEANINYQREANAAQMAYNSAEAEKARQWNEYMSNTQVQRAMADYQAAGLNPLMAIPNGASYAAPASASASLSSPNIKANTGWSEAMSSISSAASSMTNLLLVSKMFGLKGAASNLRSTTSGLKSIPKWGGFTEL